MSQHWTYNKVPILLSLISFTFYLIFAFDLDRADITKLLLLYFALFVCAFKIIKSLKVSFNFLVGITILFRLVFLFATPNLSQDYFRFIWDGRMLLEGFNPYLYLPINFFEAENFPINQGLELYNGLGEISASNYTNYPPINQLCFLIAALFSGNSITGSIIVMRIIIIGADLGTLYFGKKLLEGLGLPAKRIFWYLLNPFIIIELTGNLHFEGVMVFFLVWGIYLLNRNKWQWASVLIGCSISVKLIPLILLPLFFKFFSNIDTIDKFTIDYKKLISFYAIIGVTILIFYFPFFSTEFLTNYSESVGLWFGNFEFNASIYYLAREIGYWLTGYNEIAIISKILSIITSLSILVLAFFRKNSSIKELLPSMVLALSFYFFLSTTVHPWYLGTLIAISIFTRFRYPYIWSLFIVLSYTAYTNPEYKENLWLVALQYSAVFGLFIWEIYSLKKKELFL